jgi:GUN4-like
MSQQDVLISTVGADYTKLRDLLASGQWQKADEETGEIMRKIA